MKGLGFECHAHCPRGMHSLWGNPLAESESPCLLSRLISALKPQKEQGSLYFKVMASSDRKICSVREMGWCFFYSPGTGGRHCLCPGFVNSYVSEAGTRDLSKPLLRHKVQVAR